MGRKKRYFRHPMLVLLSALIMVFCAGITVFADDVNLPGSGTEDDPYTIGSSSNWTTFVDAVNNGHDFSGEYVKMTDDIVCSQNKTAGLREDKPFSGDFDGGGFTLEVNNNQPYYNSLNYQGAAPFRFIRNTAIHDIKVTGTVISKNEHSAGLVGFADGTNLKVPASYMSTHRTE